MEITADKIGVIVLGTIALTVLGDAGNGELPTTYYYVRVGGCDDNANEELLDLLSRPQFQILRDKTTDKESFQKAVSQLGEKIKHEYPKCVFVTVDSDIAF